MSTTEAAPLLKTHKIRLRPTARQRRLLAQNCGYARKAYNAALAHSQQHAEKEKKKPQRERRYLRPQDLSNWWTAAKKTVCVDKAGQPWYQECNQIAAKNAIVHGLRAAYDNWRRNRWNKHSAPTFHKKGRHDSYRASNGRNTVKIEGQHVFLPKIGRVRMREPLRFTGDVLIVTVSRTADWWDVAITVETPDVAPPPRTAPVAGVDVGINPLAMVSDGTRYENPRAFARMERKLRRLQKAAARSRNVHGRNRKSNRRNKVYRKIARLHARVAYLRQDTCHKATTAIAKQWGALGIESLHVKGMLRNRKLAKSLADASMGELRRQLTYKADWYGVTLVKADQWYPSTQTCSACGVKREEKVTLGEREFVCHDCGFHSDRDLNAALNLRAQAETAVARGGRETKKGRGGDVSPMDNAVMRTGPGRCTSEASTP